MDSGLGSIRLNARLLVTHTRSEQPHRSSSAVIRYCAQGTFLPGNVIIPTSAVPFIVRIPANNASLPTSYILATVQVGSPRHPLNNACQYSIRTPYTSQVMQQLWRLASVKHTIAWQVQPRACLAVFTNMPQTTQTELLMTMSASLYCAQLTGQTVFPVAVETQTAIQSTIIKAVSDIAGSSYVDAISENQTQGIANVSVVVEVMDEVTNEPAVSTSCPDISPSVVKSQTCVSRALSQG